MKKIDISFEEYGSLIEALSQKIIQSERQYDLIICLARGGMLVGDILSRLLQLPLAVMFTSSYQQNGIKADTVRMSDIATIDAEKLKGRVLLVDDLVDSGATIIEVSRKLRSRYQSQSIDTAVLWWKYTSKVRPNFWVQYLNEKENAWIVQPFEAYETKGKK